MDEEGREVYLKILKMLVAKDRNKKIVNEEWNSYWEWYLKFKGLHKCPVLMDGSHFWTSKCLSSKDCLWLTLRECLLSHRWKQALDTLILLADTPVYRSTYTIPRVAMELIFQMGMNHEMFNKMINTSKDSLKNVSKKEITLDAFLFSLVTKFSEGLDPSNTSVRLFAELSKTLKEGIRRTQNYRFYNSSSELLNNHLFDDVYKGLAAYAKWLLTRIELDGMGKELSEERAKLLEILQVQFKEATEHFSRGVEEEGHWSSFVAKVVEMVEYQAGVEEDKELLLRAELVMQIYLKKQPQDLACNKMLHAFYLRHPDLFPVHKRVKLLREIVHFSPSDPLALKLVKEEEQVGKKVRLLVTYLHYHKEHHKAWMMLVSVLQASLTIDKDKQLVTKTLQSLVSQRELHKSMFFFSPAWSVVSKLVVVKAIVACLLMGRKCPMYQGVKKLIQNMHTKPSLLHLFKSVKHSSYNIEM